MQSKMASLVSKWLLQKHPLPLKFREISFHTPPTEISQKNFRKSRLRLLGAILFTNHVLRSRRALGVWLCCDDLQDMATLCAQRKRVARKWQSAVASARAPRSDDRKVDPLLGGETSTNAVFTAGDIARHPKKSARLGRAKSAAAISIFWYSYTKRCISCIVQYRYLVRGWNVCARPGGYIHAAASCGPSPACTRGHARRHRAQRKERGQPATRASVP